jgi:hypothetical protein
MMGAEVGAPLLAVRGGAGAPGMGRMPAAKCCDLKNSCTMWLDSSVEQLQICAAQTQQLPGLGRQQGGGPAGTATKHRACEVQRQHTPSRTRTPSSPGCQSAGHTPPCRTCSGCAGSGPALHSRHKNKLSSCSQTSQALLNSWQQHLPSTHSLITTGTASKGSSLPSSTSTATRNLGFRLYRRSVGTLAPGRTPVLSTCTLLLTVSRGLASRPPAPLKPARTRCCVQAVCCVDVLGSGENVARDTG